MFSTEILKYIVCPIGKKELKLEADFLVCTNCGVKFPIIDDIPSLIVDDAVLPEGVKSINELTCMKK